MGMSVFNEIVSCVKFSFSPSFRAKVSRRKKIKLSGGRKKSEMTCRERRGTKCFICLVQSSCQHLPAYIRRVFFLLPSLCAQDVTFINCLLTKIISNGTPYIIAIAIITFHLLDGDDIFVAFGTVSSPALVDYS